MFFNPFFQGLGRTPNNLLEIEDALGPCRTAVLRKLGHVTAEGVVSMKGRAACEISTGDELLTTELMFNGVFNSLDKHQLVALISCLVPVEKSNVSLILNIPGAQHLSSA